nr:MAG TPA: hypothetical protein [Caudoviricetes sp.]
MIPSCIFILNKKHNSHLNLPENTPKPLGL